MFILKTAGIGGNVKLGNSVDSVDRKALKENSRGFGL